jgi:hypothetical protein
VIPKFISLLIIIGLLGAAPALAGQRICADQPDSNLAVLDLPAQKDNFLLTKGDPKARYVMRFESTCRRGHSYRAAGPEVSRHFLGSCFQPSKLHVSARQGCLIVEIESQNKTHRRR